MKKLFFLFTFALMLLSLNSCDEPLFNSKCDRLDLEPDMYTKYYSNEVFFKIKLTDYDRSQLIRWNSNYIAVNVTYTKHRCSGDNTVIASFSQNFNIPMGTLYIENSIRYNVSTELRNYNDFFSIDVNAVLYTNKTPISSTSMSDSYEYQVSNGSSLKAEFNHTSTLSK
jgi:hypothetical protein